MDEQSFSFCDLTLLVWWSEGHLACKRGKDGPLCSNGLCRELCKSSWTNWDAVLDV